MPKSGLKSSAGIFRGTFELVLAAQNTLRKVLDMLIKENRAIKDDDERDDFIDLLARSTLGLGRRINVKVSGGNPGGENNYDIEFTDIHSFALKLAYHNGKNFTDFNGNVSHTSYSNLWRVLRDILFRVWGLALDRAASMSAERVEATKLRAGHIRPESGRGE